MNQQHQCFLGEKEIVLVSKSASRNIGFPPSPGLTMCSFSRRSQILSFFCPSWPGINPGYIYCKESWSRHCSESHPTGENSTRSHRDCFPKTRMLGIPLRAGLFFCFKALWVSLASYLRNRQHLPTECYFPSLLMSNWLLKSTNDFHLVLL